MPHKHGLSHALATLVCTVIASLMAYMLAEYLPIHLFFRAGEYLTAILDLPFSTDAMAIALLATLLSFVWGVGFYYLHKER
jgi:hypothetical protein